MPLDLVYRAVYRVVYDHIVEFILLLQLALCGLETLLHLGLILPVPRRRLASSSKDGGAMNTITASGRFFLICIAPCTSISRITSKPLVELFVDRRLERAVVVADILCVLRSAPCAIRFSKSAFSRK